MGMAVRNLASLLRVAMITRASCLRAFSCNASSGFKKTG